MEFSTEPSFTNESWTSVFDFANNESFDGTWDLTNLTYTVENDISGDY